MTDAEYAAVKVAVRSALALDLDAYKPAQMRRRIGAFVTRRAGSVGRFCTLLPDDAELQRDLRAMITINVSEFFRDAHEFERLRTHVLPALLEDARSLRVWSAGCSHGAEAYSIAVLLDELGAGKRSSVVGTDIDAEMLARARAGGPYGAHEVRAFPPGLRGRWLEQRDDGWHVAAALRERARFLPHDLLSDAPGSRFDLIVCRNVMIYFTPAVKRALVRRLGAALRPGGILFVGATEGLLATEHQGFERIGGNFYRRADGLAKLARTA